MGIGMTKNTTINLVYAITLFIGLIALVVIGFYMNDVTGYIIYMVISVLCGIVALVQKHRAGVWWVWLLLWLSAGFGFPIAVLCLKAREKKVRIRES